MLKSRRGFFRRSGLIVGGTLVVGASPSPLLAQAGGNNPLQDCSPIPPPPATAVPFVPDTSISVRTRYSAFNMPAARVTQLRQAYKLMRDLTQNSPDDPRGWLRQANVHCWYCGGENGDGVNAGPEVHGSWTFLPWHRMFLYVHERILGELVGDNTLTLPFWDWDTTVHDRLPPIFADPMANGVPQPALRRESRCWTGRYHSPVHRRAACNPANARPALFRCPGRLRRHPEWPDLLCGDPRRQPPRPGSHLDGGSLPSVSQRRHGYPGHRRARSHLLRSPRQHRSPVGRMAQPGPGANQSHELKLVCRKLQLLQPERQSDVDVDELQRHHRSRELASLYLRRHTGPCRPALPSHRDGRSGRWRIGIRPLAPVA